MSAIEFVVLVLVSLGAFELMKCLLVWGSHIVCAIYKFLTRPDAV